MYPELSASWLLGMRNRSDFKTKWRELKVCVPRVLPQQNIRLKCHEHFCIRCSVFENNETVADWRDGQSVAYCKRCFQEKMECETLSNSNYKRMESSQEARHSSNKQDSIKGFAFGIYY